VAGPGSAARLDAVVEAAGALTVGALVGPQEAGRLGMAPGAIFQTGAGGRTRVAERLREASLELARERAPTEAAAAITEAASITRPCARSIPHSPW
jgi:hypothetical protein